MTYEEKRRWGTGVLYAKQKASYSKTLTYKVNGTGLNTTGYTGSVAITVNGKTAITLTTAVGGGMTINTAGVIVFSLTRTQMGSLPLGRHGIYIEITPPAGTEDVPVFDGTFVVE